MATTGMTVDGKYTLFKYGWIGPSGIAKIRLYDATDTLVDTQDVTFAYNAGDQSIRPTADVVFDVPAGTNDVSYVELWSWESPVPPTVIEAKLYIKVLPALYDFTTAGTLTIDSFVLTLSGTYLTTAGKQKLWVDGWDDVITWAKLYSGGTSLVDTQTTSFTASVSTGVLSCDADIIFDVTGGTNFVDTVELGYTDGTDIVVYDRTLSSTYNFATTGTLTLDSWSITVG